MMIWCIPVFFFGVWLGRGLGRAGVARYVWNMLINNRSEGMVEAVCLYVANDNPTIMANNGFHNIQEAHNAIRSGRELVDN